MILGVCFFENELKPTWFGGPPQGAAISLSHCRHFLFYQMEVKLLKLTSLLSSVSFLRALLLLGGFTVSCEAAAQFPPLCVPQLKERGLLLMKSVVSACDHRLQYPLV